MGAIKEAIGDAVLTFMWAFCASSLGAMNSEIATALGVQGLLYPSLLITTLLFFVLIFVFTLIGESLLGGASFNPTGNASFYAAGLGSDSLFSMAIRFPAQAAGAVGGTLAIMEFMPKQYKHTLGGPSLKVDLLSGAIAEGLLTFLMTFAVLLVSLRGPRSLIMKTWLLAVATVSLIFVGSNYTGPAMNPTFAFGWAYVDKLHNTWEHYYVYWICPFIGTILASWVFRLLFPTSSRPAKQKKA